MGRKKAKPSFSVPVCLSSLSLFRTLSSLCIVLCSCCANLKGPIVGTEKKKKKDEPEQPMQQRRRSPKAERGITRKMEALQRGKKNRGRTNKKSNMNRRKRNGKIKNKNKNKARARTRSMWWSPSMMKRQSGCSSVWNLSGTKSSRRGRRSREILGVVDNLGPFQSARQALGIDVYESREMVKIVRATTIG